MKKIILVLFFIIGGCKLTDIRLMGFHERYYMEHPFCYKETTAWFMFIPFMQSDEIIICEEIKQKFNYIESDNNVKNKELKEENKKLKKRN